MNEEETKQIQARVEFLERETQHQKLMIAKLRHQLFGSKSEKIQLPEPEQSVFNEFEQAANRVTDQELDNQTEFIAGYNRKKGKQTRKPFPENLEREVVEIDLQASEKICPHDGTELKRIGEETTEKLKTYPARSVVLIEKKLKYACPCCASHVAQAKSDSVLPQTIATPELLSYIMFSKFFQALPLYRLEELYKLQGIQLSRGLMSTWMIKVSEKLQPIWNILEEWALQSGYMAIDATHVQVLREPGRDAKTKSFMWARGSPELEIVLFDYDVSGGGEVAKKLMLDFKGALQADAHKGYGQLDRKRLLLLGCMMHARRRFHSAWLEVNKQPGLAADALKMIKRSTHLKRLINSAG